ncbi:hypothetical protein Pelo_18605 [Pelomyxa schiedti]|nr:hypothetical protein Pelo_18605 [Pelomyxa schiedti]
MSRRVGDEWAIEPHVRYRDQFVALMISSHARCGRFSPAAALTAASPQLMASLHESWSAGLVVLQSNGLSISITDLSKLPLLLKSERVVVASRGVKSGKLRLLCRNPTQNLFLENLDSGLRRGMSISTSLVETSLLWRKLLKFMWFILPWVWSFSHYSAHPTTYTTSTVSVIACSIKNLLDYCNQTKMSSEWVMERHVRYQDQMAALMMSSHARCGQRSPAAALTTSAPLLMASLHKSWSRGVLVLQPFFEDAVAVGVSLATFGVTSPPQQAPRGRAENPVPKFGTGTRCLFATRGRPDLDLQVADVRTGKQAWVRGFAGMDFCRATCRGEWVLDFRCGRMWRVTEDGEGDWHCGNGGGGPLVVSGPRDVKPFAGMVGKSKFSFRQFVGDRFFDMRCFGAEWCVFHLFDMERMFESGVMEPVDTVMVPRHPHMSRMSAHCFWASKRVMLQSEGVYYELLEGGELKLLCRSDPTDNFFMDNFWISQSKDQPNQYESWDFSACPKAEQPTVISLPESDLHLRSGGDLLIVEGGSRVHAVDPASGAIIFTLMAPLLQSGPLCLFASNTFNS